MDEAQGVWVYCDFGKNKITKHTYELVSEARRIADIIHDKVTLVLIGYGCSAFLDDLKECGSDFIVCIDKPLLKEFDSKLYTDILSYLIDEYRPCIFLFSSTENAKILSARVAARKRLGLTADCVKLDIDSENKILHMIRPAFEASLMADIISPDTRPQMATVRSGISKIEKKHRNLECRIIYKDYELDEDKWVTTLNQSVETENDSQLKQLDIAFGIGAGIGSKENVELVKELARIIGASVYCTREVVEQKWLNEEYQVGLSGRVIHPKLYIAMGISGAAQHIIGLKDVNTLIAINNDPLAPIFDVADIGIVNDVSEVLKRLVYDVNSNN